MDWRTWRTHHVQGAGHASGIDGEAADELPGPALVEVAERQGQQVRMECDEHVVPDQQLRMCEQDLRAQAQQGDGPGDQQEEPRDVESDLDGIGRVEVEEGGQGRSDVVQREIGQAGSRLPPASRERIQRGGQHQGPQGQAEADRHVQHHGARQPTAVGTHEPLEEPSDRLWRARLGHGAPIGPVTRGASRSAPPTILGRAAARRRRARA